MDFFLILYITYYSGGDLILIKTPGHNCNYDQENINNNLHYYEITPFTNPVAYHIHSNLKYKEGGSCAGVIVTSSPRAQVQPSKVCEQCRT